MTGPTLTPRRCAQALRRRQHSDDGEAPPIEHDGSPNDVRIAVERSLPHTVTDNHDGRGSGAVVRRNEVTAYAGDDPECAKEVC